MAPFPGACLVVRCAVRVPPASRTPRASLREVAQLDAIEVRGLTRSFDIDTKRVVALSGLDLRVAEREIVAVVGPNGCGKSTLLRVIGGLLQPEQGSVRINAEPQRGPDERVGLVFQEPRLLPWRDVLANVAFPLELAGMDRPQRESKALEALELAGLHGFAEATPAQLSGGMAQRAALARALVGRPEVLLLDEPFSALDALTRDRLDAELLSLWQRTGTTIVLVTHSIPEAVFLADRVLVMSARPGRVVADIVVDVPRPRSLAGADSAAFGATAALVRAALTDSEEHADADTLVPGDMAA